MYWLIMDPYNMSKLKNQIISFLRKGNAIYQVKRIVEDLFDILKIPHSSHMRRIQRKEYARVNIDEPVKVDLILD